MKLTCDCGAEMRLKRYEDWNDEVDDAETEVNYKQDYSSGIELHGEHDEIWITCNSCGRVFHFFT